MLTYALAPAAEEAAAEVSAAKVQGDPDIATKQASIFIIYICIYIFRKQKYTFILKKEKEKYICIFIKKKKLLKNLSRLRDIATKSRRILVETEVSLY
jgi:hypothetical protein